MRKSAKRLSLEEIISLPLATVVWCETHDLFEIGETELEYYQILPMMVVRAGSGGLVSWADEESCRRFRINGSMISGSCSFWDSQPEPEQIESGIPYEEATSLFNNFERTVLSP